MASNIERLTIKDTFTNWRDKINLLIDVAILAPMADEDGVMHVDIPHCNTRKVVFDVPVEFSGDVQAVSMECSESFVSSLMVTTIQETANAGLKMVGHETEGYIPWVSGRTQNGTASLWTSTYDDSIHFSYVNLDGELVGTYSWNPELNTVSAKVSGAAKADLALTSEKFILDNLSDTPLPGSYPVYFGKVEDGQGSGAWDESLTYNPREGIFSADVFRGSLDGNAKSASKADKLTEKRRISLGTDATGYMDFDGSENVVLPCSLIPTGVIPKLYGPSSNVNVPRTNRRFTVPSFRVDEKGRITQAFDRIVEFPFPEVDVDGALNVNSSNPIANSAVASRLNEIQEVLDVTPGMDTATTTTPGLMSAADKIKLNSLTQNPRINSVTVQTYDSETDSVASTTTKNLSVDKPTRIAINAKNGLSAEVGIADASGTSIVSVNLGMQLSTIAGSGLVEVNGQLAVPDYSGPTSTSMATSGLVPPASNEERNLFLNGAGEWASPVGTTYDPVSSTSSGLMTAADKAKLDGIASEASKVSFSGILTSGVKIGTITINGNAADIYAEKNTDTTYNTFIGATSSAAGKAGLVPIPAKGAQNRFLRGDATWQIVYDASQIDSKLNEKAGISGPAFTGIPTVPNAASGTNTLQAANTAFVTTAINNLKDGAPAGLDTLKEIATSIGNNTNFKKYVDDGLAGKISITSPNYIKTLSLDGKTLSGTKGDGTSFSWTTVDTNTTYTNFVKSGSGAKAGLVPAPSTTAGSTKYLCENGTWTVPAMNADEKVKNTLNTTAKAYITGTTSGSTNTGGQVFDTGVFLTTDAGTLQATTFVGDLQGNAATAAALQTARTINGVSFDGSKNITVADSTKLPLTGGTLTGNLVVKKGAPYMYLQNTSMTKGSKPSSNQYSLIALTSSAGNANGNRIGLFQSSLNTAGNVTTGIYAYRNTKDATTNAAVSVTYEAGGTAYANCPTPPAGDNSTKIATTAWVNTKTNASNGSMVPKWSSRANRSKNTTYTAGTNGFAIIYGKCNNGQDPEITINGQTYNHSFWSYTGHQNKYIIYPIAKNDKYKMRQAGYWVPAK